MPTDLLAAVLSPLVLSTFGLVFVAELPDKTALASLVLATRYPARQVIGGAWLAFLVQTLVAVVAGSLLQLLPATPVRVAAGLGFLVFAFVAARRDVDDDEDARANEEAAVQAEVDAEAGTATGAGVGTGSGSGSGPGVETGAGAGAGAGVETGAGVGTDTPAHADIDVQVGVGVDDAAAARSGSRPPWLVCFLVVFAAEWGDLTQLATAALVAQTGQPIPVAIGATAALWTVALLAVVAGSQLSRYLKPRLLKWISVAVFTLVGVIILISAFEPL